MTAQEYLNYVISLATPSDQARHKASANRSAIESWLQLDLGVFRIFETGSWSHGTAAAPWSDVDYFASMSGVRPSSSQDDLDRLHASLASRFPQAYVRVSRPVVQIRFADDSPTVEIAPAHITSDDDYFIPDPQGSGWIKSSPLKQAKYVDSARDKDSRAKPFIRLLKEWKYQRDVQISSFYLEMRAAKHILDHPPFVMLTDLNWFFRDLEADGLAAMIDPSTFDGRRISPCTPAWHANSQEWVRIAAGASKVACDADAQGQHSISEDALRVLFAP